MSVLKRKMFDRSFRESRGVGITSGLAERPSYAQGGRIGFQKRGFVGDPDWGSSWDPYSEDGERLSLMELYNLGTDVEGRTSPRRGPTEFTTPDYFKPRFTASDPDSDSPIEAPQNIQRQLPWWKAYDERDDEDIHYEEIDGKQVPVWSNTWDHTPYGYRGDE